MKKALFPGTFDPVTLGHENVVRRAAKLFDEVVVAIGVNSAKKTMFTLEQRLEWLAQTFADLDNVSVTSYSKLTVDFCQDIGAKYIVRGLRIGADFEYERTIAQMNKTLNPEVETVLLYTDPEHSAINSTVVREVWRNKGNVAHFIPSQIKLK